MNEFRLKYHHDTGIRIQDAFFCDRTEEYIEWLEEQLADALRVNGINQMLFDRDIPIFYETNKKT